ncbi:HAD family hydrolase [Jatrophihabitans telluris]|uniref:HAD family hydrolase n=1 Tax=Jatrophihabitans telluris TaxID=2038343 RepID=A0ABY4QVD7_9ACTN|nr:HAD family hydrolase [Jatrophihabitans telluris]UQX87626.1 HAD family hydrolase [Jatrophihabitans telluris]
MSSTLLPGVRAVSFDGDGTLWDLRAAMSAALSQTSSHIADRYGLTVAADALARMRDEVARDPDYRSATMEVIRGESFRRCMQRAGLTEGRGPQEVLEFFLEARFTATAPYPEVPEVLSALSQHIPLAYITNGNTILERVGLAGYFKVAIVGQEIGVRKPDPRIYLRACAELDLAPHEVLHVGDDPVEDWAAARQAGLRAVLLDRAGGSDNPSDLSFLLDRIWISGH